MQIHGTQHMVQYTAWHMAQHLVHGMAQGTAHDSMWHSSWHMAQHMAQHMAHMAQHMVEQMAQNMARSTWHSVARGKAQHSRWHTVQVHDTAHSIAHSAVQGTQHGPARHVALYKAQQGSAPGTAQHMGSECLPITCCGGTSPSRATISRSSAAVPRSGTASPTRSERPPSRCSTSVTFSALGTSWWGCHVCPRCGGASMHPSLLDTATSCALSSPHTAQMTLFGAGCSKWCWPSPHHALTWSGARGWAARCTGMGRRYCSASGSAGTSGRICTHGQANGTALSTHVGHRDASLGAGWPQGTATSHSARTARGTASSCSL